MKAVHAFITEVLSNFVYSFKTADDKAFQIKLGSNTHIHVDIESIKMSDEWLGTCTTGNTLQNRCLYFRISVSVEKLAHGAQNSGTLEKGVFYTVIDDKINITLTGTLLRIIKLIISDTIFIFHDGKGLQTLAEKCYFLSMYRYFTGLCLEYKTFYADNITNIKQFLKYFVIKILIFVRANIIAGYIYLDSSFRIL